MKNSKSERKIPYDFILEKLEVLRPVVRPMFGCFAVYHKDRIVAALRKKDKGDPDNGMWLATSHEHHATLKNDFPSMRSIRILGKKDTGWQVLPENSDTFEEEVSKACDLIIKGDSRIGKIPKAKKKKTT